MSSFRIGSISWCCFVVTLFHYSMVFRLFCQYSVVCYTSVPMFHQCSGVPCSGVPGFMVYPDKRPKQCVDVNKPHETVFKHFKLDMPT